MCGMDEFDQRLTEILKQRPGLTRERLAAALAIEFDEAFRERLRLACDRGAVHKVHDKYYPGEIKSY
jgi:hypothetical protein